MSGYYLYKPNDTSSSPCGSIRSRKVQGLFSLVRHGISCPCGTEYTPAEEVNFAEVTSHGKEPAERGANFAPLSGTTPIFVFGSRESSGLNQKSTALVRSGIFLPESTS